MLCVTWYLVRGYHCFVGRKVYNGAFLFWQWQVVYVDLDAESRGTAACGTSDGSAAREVCEAFAGDWGRHAPVAEVSGMGAVVYGGPRWSAVSRVQR